MEDILTVLNSGWYKVKEDITEEKIMNEVYNFIVDEKITDAERKVFINFKNKIGEKVDFSEALMALSYD